MLIIVGVWYAVLMIYGCLLNENLFWKVFKLFYDRLFKDEDKNLVLNYFFINFILSKIEDWDSNLSVVRVWNELKRIIVEGLNAS